MFVIGCLGAMVLVGWLVLSVLNSKTPGKQSSEPTVSESFGAGLVVAWILVPIALVYVFIRSCAG